MSSNSWEIRRSSSTHVLIVGVVDASQDERRVVFLERSSVG